METKQMDKLILNQGNATNYTTAYKMWDYYMDGGSQNVKIYEFAVRKNQPRWMVHIATRSGETIDTRSYKVRAEKSFKKFLAKTTGKEVEIA